MWLEKCQIHLKMILKFGFVIAGTFSSLSYDANYCTLQKQTKQKNKHYKQIPKVVCF